MYKKTLQKIRGRVSFVRFKNITFVIKKALSKLPKAFFMVFGLAIEFPNKSSTKFLSLENYLLIFC